MFKVDGNNIYLTRGDTAVIELTITDGEGETYDYSNDTVKFAVKRFVTDATPVIEKTFEDGSITITPEDTKELSFGPYLYDIQLTSEDGETVATVIIPSTFTVGPEVTD